MLYFCFLFNTCFLSGDSFLPKIPILNLAFHEAKQFKHLGNWIKAYFPPCNKVISPCFINSNLSKVCLVVQLHQQWPLLSGWLVGKEDSRNSCFYFHVRKRVMIFKRCLVKKGWDRRQKALHPKRKKDFGLAFCPHVKKSISFPRMFLELLLSEPKFLLLKQK